MAANAPDRPTERFGAETTAQRIAEHFGLR
jgi:hypothetical protein